MRTCALGGNEHREITLKRGDLVNLYLRQNKGVNDYEFKRDCNKVQGVPKFPRQVMYPFSQLNVDIS